MENLKLSIIIPVYNVEKYLAKCLDSVLVGNAFAGQVICVNDGSTDGSAVILEQYAKKYPNVEIITQTNHIIPIMGKAVLILSMPAQISSFDGMLN